MPTIEIDVDLNEFTDDELSAECKRRSLGSLDVDSREVNLLAEMIAAGERDKALGLLADLTDGSFHPATVKSLVDARTGVMF